ncbi:hypothetical protein GGD83_004022 [Rhodoblastus sphagnicola]|uniref:hypothetical protein n=1 Tax=Rhodoblastus sphagnicola TaxID=333368 RepID=UPI0011AFD9D3|nr:hypothetical protein [Rhodoblastus sphagnicola]MBB4200194.1 hypothetical protein [Rhodoblastus sphagnicola]
MSMTESDTSNEQARSNTFAISHAGHPSRSDSCIPVQRQIVKYGIESFEYARRRDPGIWSICVRSFAVYKQLSVAIESCDDDATRIESLKQKRRRALNSLQKARAKTVYGLILKYNIILLFLVDNAEIAALIRSCLIDYDRLFASNTQSEFSNAEPRLALLVNKVSEAVKRFEVEAERYDQCDEDGMEPERRVLLTTMRTAVSDVDGAISLVAAQPSTTLQGLRAKLFLFETFDEASCDGVSLLALKRSMCGDLDRLLRQFRRKPTLLASAKT